MTICLSKLYLCEDTSLALEHVHALPEFHIANTVSIVAAQALDIPRGSGATSLSRSLGLLGEFVLDAVRRHRMSAGAGPTAGYKHSRRSETEVAGRTGICCINTGDRIPKVSEPTQ